MNLDQIAAILNEASSAGHLDLAPDAFGAGGALPAFMHAYFSPNGRLQGSVRSIVEDQENDRVVLVMTGSSLPVVSTTVTAWFYDRGEGVQLDLTASALAGWGFSQSFPWFGPGFLDTLPLSAVTLRLVSDAAQPGGAGQFFHATLSPPEEIVWLFGGLAKIELSGPITIDREVPAFDFRAPISSPVTIGTLKDLSLDFELKSTVVQTTIAQFSGAPAETVYAAVLSMGLGASVTLGSLAAELFIDLAPSSGLISAQLAISASSVALSDFAELVGHADLASSLPRASVYDPGKDFLSASVTLLVHPKAAKLASVELVLEARPQWLLFDGTTLKDIRFEFSIFDPAGAKHVFCALSGTIAWTGGSLVVGGTAPNVTIYCALTPGSTIHLSDVLKHLLTVEVPDTLVIDEFSLTVTPAQGGISLVTGCSGVWSVDLGVTSASLEKAWVQVERSGGTTSGAIGAKAVLGDFDLDGSWQIPGEFKLSGELQNALKLSDLIHALTNDAPPSGLPDIALSKAGASISIAPSTSRLTPALRAAVRGGRVYTFAATATVATGGNDLGSMLFVVRKTPDGFGFIAGFVVPEAWSPADLLPELKGLFSSLAFSNSGLIVSSITTQNISLPNLTQPSLPSSVTPGLTAFTSLALKGDGLSQLGQLFDGSVALDLLAELDMTTPVNSKIVAKLRAVEQKGALTYLDLALTLKPAAASFTLQLSTRLTLGDEKVTLSGFGTVTLKPPSFAIGVLVSDWKEPFGVKGLTILKFGLGIAIDEVGVTINFLGSFLIGQGDRQFTFTIGGGLNPEEFGAPTAIIFALDVSTRTLMLSDLIGQFTDLDLSDVPVLEHIGFRKLDFMVVDDPSGFTIGDEHFDPGIRIDADVTLYSWEATFDLAVNTSKGVYAKGAIDKPIVIGDNILVISNVAGDKGPSGLIDTSAFVSGKSLVNRRHLNFSALEISDDTLLVRTRSGMPIRVAVQAAQPTYIEFDASVSLLKVAKQQLKMSVSKNAFDFFYNFQFLGVEETLACSFDETSKSFAASARFSFNLDVTTPALEIAGVEVWPRIHLQTPSALLDLDLSFSWRGAVSGSFNLTVDFAWKGKNIHFTAGITLAEIGNDIANLWAQLKAWIESNVRKVFSAFLDSIGDYISAIEAGLLDFLTDALAIARALVELFSADATQVAQALFQLAYGFEAIVGALVTAFEMGVEAAVAIVKALFGGQCSVSSANQLLYGLPQVIVDPRFVLPPGVLVDLAAKPHAEKFLTHYYMHQEELRVLLAQNHPLRASFHGMAAGFGPDETPLAPLVLSAMEILEPHGSLQLRESLGILRPEIEMLGDLSYAEVISVLPDR
jgi:hypothetical protein